ncbi:hypothetical protein HWI79_1530 [Cryptosporidium felis]|nr:hypothetical protein HWI79_1530 [Cryptosporidium felis]
MTISALSCKSQLLAKEDFLTVIGALSFSTLSNNVTPKLLQFATGLTQALFFATKLSQYQIIISPVVTIKKGEVFAKIVPSPDEKDTSYDVLNSPCDGVLQYVWPNILTPSIAFMLVARIQCNKNITLNKE